MCFIPYCQHSQHKANNDLKVSTVINNTVKRCTRFISSPSSLPIEFERIRKWFQPTFYCRYHCSVWLECLPVWHVLCFDLKSWCIKWYFNLKVYLQRVLIVRQNEQNHVENRAWCDAEKLILKVVEVFLCLPCDVHFLNYNYALISINTLTMASLSKMVIWYRTNQLPGTLRTCHARPKTSISIVQ